MLNNELSNQMAPIMSFNFERIICEEFSIGWKLKYKINEQHVNAINTLYRKDFSIWYVSFQVPERKLDKVENSLEKFGCLFQGMLLVKDAHSLHFFLKAHQNAAYFDTDRDLVTKLYPFGKRWEEYIVQVWNKEG
jgi:hypothetical protein